MKTTSIYVSPKECEYCEWLKADFTCGAPDDFRCGQENKKLIEKLNECSRHGYITLLEEEAREIIKRLKELEKFKGIIDFAKMIKTNLIKE